MVNLEVPPNPPRERHTPDPDFGPALRAARHRAGRSLRALAKQAGISLGYLSMLERGQRAPSVVTTTALSRALPLTRREQAVFTRAGIPGVGRGYDGP